jgi:hypothetical protein
MKQLSERSLVDFIANFSPWLAPVPSAFFVTRAAMIHLNVPIIVSVVIGMVIESLGITSINTWLRLTNWNNTKRKSDPPAPVWVAAGLGLFYFISVVILTVVLEISPNLSIFAPVIFPLLAVVGAFNLSLISFQNHRELTVKTEKEERRSGRSTRPVIISSLDIANQAKKEKQKTLIQRIENELDEGNTSPTDLSRKFGKSRTTIYSYLEKIQNNGNGNGNGDHHELS